MRPSLTTKGGRSKCLVCRTRLGTKLYNRSVEGRCRCERCSTDLDSLNLLSECKKGFKVTNKGWQFVERCYAPAEQLFKIQVSHNGEDWEDRGNKPSMKFNNLSNKEAVQLLDFIQSNNYTGEFHRIQAQP